MTFVRMEPLSNYNEDDQKDLKFTLGIPTYNRADQWKLGTLLNSIVKQTRKPDEVIIVDDNSTDDTQKVLGNVKKQLEANDIPTKIFKVIEPKHEKSQASALPDNVIYNEADKESILVHIDDDGWMEPNYIETIEELQKQKKGCYYCNIVFMNPEDCTEIQKQDSRAKKTTEEVREARRVECWGAAYSCPVWLLRATGGHDMRHFPKRGADARIGNQMYRSGIPMFFTVKTNFFHLGISHFHKGDTGMKVMENRLSPYHHNYDEMICNGGDLFFNSNEMENYYETSNNN